VAGVAGSKSADGMDVRFLCLLCRLAASATGWSLIQKSTTDCDVSNLGLPRNLNNGPEFRCSATESKIECSSITEFALASVVGRQCL